ncbi:hypothetical protein PYDG_00022 [Pseudoalteromonas phage pYD6-A]|uniref:RNA polymerase n=1 Tax=Pseudoalteromonas phage pYD6-A TaxID=754052 RepID=M4T3V7_9CAUD|nr:hypothetical protein PYDG_00022 [Pseudoalteromonas phage pYD6-A]AGH57554.1 hypothetical protein PYDG_00022 [Pseudoalteromonas phage pYD6-A]
MSLSFVETNSRVDTQIATEMYFNRKAIYERIENEIDREPEIMECMFQATRAITEWAIKFDKYESKRLRLDALLEHNQIGALVRRAMVLVMMLNDRSDLITSLAGQLVSAIKGMPDHKAGVVTAGEIMTLMCDYDCFDMDYRQHVIEDEETGAEYTTNSWYVINPWELSDATVKHIKHGMYLPPMITKPQILTCNTDSAYITIEKESLILGKKNHHNKDICLDSLNRFNAIPLAMNVEYLKSVDKLMEDDVVDMSEETKQQYEKFMVDSYFVFAYLVKQGNKFYLSYKVDKRGRSYSQGYHCNVQGNKFRKGAVDLADKEIVNGTFC